MRATNFSLKKFFLNFNELQVVVWDLNGLFMMFEGQDTVFEYIWVIKAFCGVSRISIQPYFLCQGQAAVLSGNNMGQRPAGEPCFSNFPHHRNAQSLKTIWHNSIKFGTM